MKRHWKTLTSLCIALAPAVAFAQDYPAKPIRMLVAFPPASTGDVIARVVGPKLGEGLGQPVIVENRGGAGGNIGAQVVSKAAPDGYTILTTSSAIAVNVSLYKNPGFSAKDLVPVAHGGATPNMIFAHPSVPANNLQELFALARTKPMSYASAGTGTGTQLMMEMLKKQAKVDITHVPFNPAAAVTAVVGDQASMGITSIPMPLAQVKGGKLRPIAVTTPKRVASLPNVPTVAESGFPGFEDVTWFAFFVPAATPSPIVARLNAELNRAMVQPEVKAKFATIHVEFTRTTPTEIAEYVRKEMAKYARFVKETGAKAD
ncbi:MAG: hypothetical protein A3G27_13815 [Betaproteobacteria bacterium RIFCSPLOWO2_12_FULL_66_14]|nr:MAG: hypothetical protein A3G27_13815 [Betaproteobacteria bacterium RIFCSPLOWO2_12_FULL_66_14]